MKHTVHHGLDHDLARKAIRKAFKSYEERFSKYNAQANWLNEDQANVSFSARGITLSGAVEVTDEDVEVDMDVPFILRPFKKKAIAVIDEELRGWVDRAQRGELD
jgi:hypothetical protein